jgi:hypothetical protein
MSDELSDDEVRCPICGKPVWMYALKCPTCHDEHNQLWWVSLEGYHNRKTREFYPHGEFPPVANDPARHVRDKATNQSAPPPRLSVRRNPPTATFDGVAYGLTHEQAAMLDLLLTKAGEWVTPAEFEEDELLRDARRDRLRNNLPKQLSELIQSSGAGYRLKLPPPI